MKEHNTREHVRHGDAVIVRSIDGSYWVRGKVARVDGQRRASVLFRLSNYISGYFVVPVWRCQRVVRYGR